MSKPSYRFTLIHQAIITSTLFGMGVMSAQAVSLGQATVDSAQHEPLFATIPVENIDAKNFNASVAPTTVYEQMGLNQDTPIEVKFTAISEKSGKLTLTSSSPISKPFTDVVLNLNNNGEQHLEPQTLLMPLPKQGNIAPDLSRPIMVAAEQMPNLPVVSNPEPVASNPEVALGNPLQVQNIAPPPLFPEVSEEIPENTPLVASTPTIEPTPATVVETNGTQSTSNDEQAAIIAAITPESANQQLQTLTEQVTRRYFPAGAAPKATQPIMVEAESVDDAPKTEEALVANTPTSEANTPTSTETEPATQSSTGAVYVVQSGDNLWSIANEIAKANNINITDVMNELHQQNPDAFNKGKINQLKANANLAIPSYDVVPSQKAIQDAIAAKRQATSANTTAKASAKGSNKGAKASNTQAKKTSSRSTQATKAQSRPKTATTPLPKAQMTLVAPSNGGQATGQSKSTTAKGSGVGTATNNNQLVSTLKSTRSQTAANATRLNGLNQQLSSATHKLQLQNQKLAELEARLKALKEK